MDDDSRHGDGPGGRSAWEALHRALMDEVDGLLYEIKQKSAFVSLSADELAYAPASGEAALAPGDADTLVRGIHDEAAPIPHLAEVARCLVEACAHPCAPERDNAGVRVQWLAKRCSPRWIRTPTSVPALPECLLYAMPLDGALVMLIQNLHGKTSEEGTITVSTSAQPVGRYPEGGYLRVEVATSEALELPAEVVEALHQPAPPLLPHCPWALAGTWRGVLVAHLAALIHGGRLEVSRSSAGTSFAMRWPFVPGEDCPLEQLP